MNDDAQQPGDPPPPAPAKTPEPEPEPATRWERVRAVLIALHVLAVIVLALPSGAEFTNKRNWTNKNMRADLAAWANRFGTTPTELEATIKSYAKYYVVAHRWMIRPVLPYKRYLGVRQGWSMFSSPQRHPGEYRVEIQRGDSKEWIPIYRSRSEEYNWRAKQFDHDRLRKYVGRFGRGFVRKNYNALGRWVATNAARDFPDAVRVRVRVYRTRTLHPARVAAGERSSGRHENVRYFKAEALR